MERDWIVPAYKVSLCTNVRVEGSVLAASKLDHASSAVLGGADDKQSAGSTVA